MTSSGRTNAPRKTSDDTASSPSAQPRCSQQHVLNCQFSEWYPLFKHCTPRSTVLDLSEEAVQYLQEDGVVLPKGFEMSCGGGAVDDSDDEVNWEESEDEDADERPHFPGLHERIRAAIQSLGGNVFPKLNWSCPKDAAWVNGGSLKCPLPGDVLCLLKSSTFVSHDLNHAFDTCLDATVSRPATFTLVLRKWCNLHPSMLFRCFVRDRRLVGICQRDCTSYYAFLEGEAGRLSDALENFFAAEICKTFPDPNCVADVYVDSRSRVWLLDINPFASVTDSLLFDWAEDVLAAPLPPQPQVETLPPDVFLRLRVEPASIPPRGNVHQAAERNESSSAVSGQNDTSSTSASTGGVDAAEVVRRADIGCTLVNGDSGLSFEFRFVPSSMHMVPDPMGRYRGPADVEMGTLMGGTGGGDLEELIESCRLAAVNN